MNKLIIFTLVVILAFISCDKTDGTPSETKPTILPNSILAGQQSGQGIYYVDLEPDISILRNWEQFDTSIFIDLNNDGTDDFIFEREISSPYYMGGGLDKIKIISQNQNEIVVLPAPYPDPIQEPCMHSSLDWVDTLLVSDPIDIDNIWTNSESLILKDVWSMKYCSVTDGLWSEVYNSDDKYIGFKVIKDDKNYFGWIGFYHIKANDIFVITDYAITQEYEAD